MDHGRLHSQAQQSPASLEVTDSTPKPKRVIKRTPAQLAKKRIQDREAQRVSREKIKNLIAEQEQQLQQLKAENELRGQRLQAALKEKEIAQAEAYALRQRLNATEKKLQELNSCLASAAGILNPAHQALDYSISTNHDQKRSPCSPSNNNADAILYHDFVPHASSDSISPQNPQYSSASTSPSSTEYWQSSNATTPIGYSSTSCLLPPIASSVPRSMGQYLSKVLQEPVALASNTGNDRIPHPWSVHVKLVPPTCPLDDIMTSFVASRRFILAQGGSELTAAGPAQPSMAGLLKLDTIAPIHAVSQVLTDVIAKIESINSLPEKVGSLWLTSQFLRWQISPTRENYERLPEWVRPLPSQNTIPHPLWMDYIPWPQMRDELVKDNLRYDQNEFFLPYVQQLSLNWPYKPMECVAVFSTGREALINPAFELHIRNLENWSLGSTFSAAYPSLFGTYRLKDP
ncbi:hypothetical protein AOQ84DRAFT_328306 [Glonium stellatum]|uniref:BZIP transcription factor n=1 Tax=Glonium stellatum TaxID=574774 RepID=A0A8E2JLK6_9PEZI|nr:hypothetical protein AOQ84DRAFT_328306 [Glonium stellatum]